ncbi:GTPase Era [Pacificimonas flava]|uniref:GTPase Era n=1 Tax=Pacificimonas flava TaxID=1234595 RepID=M2U931_9SPHN|nr:GTPase Era [Pacificimonas flava]EMD84498.1 GTP-binding protein Era [Pacificimonas flava]MBB5279630.1 GTP-binding protein Era [Pacificimonas flava]
MTEERCGFIAVIGAPNAGKSTLVNTLVGQKVAIVSPRVQTTRARLMGVAVEDETQMILIDTPGIFTPKKTLERAMVHTAWEGTRGADLILMLVDSKRGLTDEVEEILKSLESDKTPKMLILTKVDIAPKQNLLLLTQRLNRRGDFAETFMISAETGDGMEDLKATLLAAMPRGNWHFPADQISDVSSRLIAAEITREKIFLQLYQELPYATAVETESWTEGENGITIHQTIYVERDSQKGIVLGKGGSRIKQIGSASRGDLEDMFGQRIHLFLTVKVKPDWAERKDVLSALGLDMD